MTNYQNQYHLTDENLYIMVLKTDICYFQQDDVLQIFLSSFLLKHLYLTVSKTSVLQQMLPAILNTFN